MSYRYLFFDFPSDHEGHVEGGPPTTECDLVRAILAGRGLGENVTQVRATTRLSLRGRIPESGYGDIRFVHVAGHASRKGMSLIGEVLPWKELAEILKRFCAPLEEGKDRALCLSCSESATGIRTLQSELKGSFTGCYYFTNPEIGYADALTAWSVFYLQKNPATPFERIFAENEQGERVRVDTARLVRSIVPEAELKFVGLGGRTPPVEPSKKLWRRR